MWYRWDWSIEGCPQLLAVKEIADWTYSIRLFKGWSSGRKAYDLSKWTKRTRVPYTLGAEPFGHRIEYENRVRIRSCLTGVDLRMESLETNQSILCRHLSNWCQQPTEIQNANTLASKPPVDIMTKRRTFGLKEHLARSRRLNVVVDVASSHKVDTVQHRHTIHETVFHEYVNFGNVTLCISFLDTESTLIWDPTSLIRESPNILLAP
jgi:hypothetical protein